MAQANQITCPHCGQPYAVRPDQWPQYHGRTINCTRCGKPFTITAPPEFLAAPAQPQPAAGVHLPGVGPGVQQPGIGAYAPGTYPPSPTVTSGWAIASLVIGIVSFCVPVIGSLTAVVTGIIGMNKTRDPRVGGRGLAIAGIALGAVSTVMLVPLVAISLPALTHAREAANRARCAANVRHLGEALTAYANENGGRFPDKFEDVLKADPSLDRHLFVCPDDDKTPPSADSLQTAAHQISTGQNCSYVYVGGDLTESASPDDVLLYEPLSDHHGGITVLFADGRVEWLDKSRAKQVLGQEAAGSRPITVNPNSPETP